MSRTPQPCSFLFLIEMTKQSIESGMVEITLESILKIIDNLPKRTQIGLITFNSTIQFYNLKKSLLQSQMLVIGELDEIILPLPSTQLLVDLEDSKNIFKILLKQLKSIKSEIKDSCLGSTLKSAGKLLSSIGGKILCF